MSEEFLSSRIFKIEYNQAESEQSSNSDDVGIEVKLNEHELFHFVHLKVRVTESHNGDLSLLHMSQPGQTQTRRIILQIIDVSDKLLFDDIKAEYQFHSMINAAVSHELRNPLNSMIGQLHYMNFNLGTMKQAIEIIDDDLMRNNKIKQQGSVCLSQRCSIIVGYRLHIQHS